MNPNHVRHHHLHEQRLLQIQRDGIFVQLENQHGLSEAYLEFNMSDKIKAEKLLASKIKLGLFTERGDQLLIFDFDSFYFKHQRNNDKNRIYLTSKNKIKRIPTQNLILAKNNATIGVFKKVCLNQHRNLGVYPKIDKFINDPNFLDIQINGRQNILEFYAQNDLNQSQNQAIKKSFQFNVSFIKGPPGCGKTRTIARILKLFAQKQLKVLVGAVSNVANKSLLKQIINQIEDHNLNKKKQVKKTKLLLFNSRLQEENESAQMKRYSFSWKVMKQFLQINTNQFFDKSNILNYMREFQMGKTMTNTFLSIYYQATNKVIAQADIIISTTVSATKINNKIQKQNMFYPDLCLIDQASQATWTDANCFLILGMERIVFVGDQKQLQPTVISQNAQLKKTMFQELSLKTKKNFTLLNIQYRMNPLIAQFPNKHFYEGKLLNSKLAEQQVSEIEYFKDYPLSFIEHNQHQSQFVQNKANLQDGKKHFHNLRQVKLIVQILHLFPKSQLKNVGIITFYDLQLQHLNYHLNQQVIQHGLTIRTCDGYQGGEKDYIIVSTVRCNMEGKIGFCKEDNRVNVTITRAKKGLILLGNGHTLMQGKKIEDSDENLNVWGCLMKHLYTRSLIFTIEAVSQYWNEKQSIESIQSKQKQ